MVNYTYSMRKGVYHEINSDSSSTTQKSSEKGRRPDERGGGLFLFDRKQALVPQEMFSRYFPATNQKQG